jgi:pyridoxal phosphate enzyme (YggS family)
LTVLTNLAYVKQELEQTCSRIGRQAQEVTLIAVTKSVTTEKALEVLDAGLLHLGENRNEGLLAKYEEIGSRAIWHFIGSLQTRKVKDIINIVDYIHSLDRLSLAAEIQKRATKRIRCFVQVKTSAEEAKQGISPSEALDFIKQLAIYDKIEVVGLMTMAPYTENTSEIRHCFRQLKELQLQVQAQELPHAPCHELSMGMSNDFSIAVEEGATFIRLGTILVK